MGAWPGKFVIGLSGNVATGKGVVRKMVEQTLGPQKAEMLLKELQSSNFSDMVDILANLDAKTSCSSDGLLEPNRKAPDLSH